MPPTTPVDRVYRQAQLLMIAIIRIEIQDDSHFKRHSLESNPFKYFSNFEFKKTAYPSEGYINGNAYVSVRKAVRKWRMTMFFDRKVEISQIWGGQLVRYQYWEFHPRHFLKISNCSRKH